MQEVSRQPVVGATLRLTSQADSTKRLFAITDTAGFATLAASEGQTYRLLLTSVGYKPLTKNIRVAAAMPVQTLTLETDNITLKGVTVTAPKPLVRQEDDKTVVDPEPIAATSTSAYEIMEKTPGVFLDPDGNVYLSSTSPATIYINGREQKMSAADVASMLKSLPPNAIARIEILRTPSARYDASGSGGVVNIILKKGVSLGLTGSANAGFNQGRYGNQFAGVNLSKSQGGRSSYLNLNYTRRNNYEEVQTSRAFSPDTVLNQNALTTYPANTYYLGYGLGYELSPKWDLDFDGRVSLNGANSDSENENIIRQISTGKLITNNLNTVDNRGRNVSFSQDISTRYKIDSLGSEVTTNWSYNYLGNRTEQVFGTQYLLPDRAPTTGEGTIDNGRHLLAGQVDYRQKLAPRFTLEAGLKSTYQTFDSRTNYFTGAARTPDRFRTNTFDYRENINAAYLQGSQTFGSFVLKAGVRLENTNMYGHQRIPTDTTFRINRTDLFPYVYLSRKIARIANFDLKSYLIYRRSITRPAYEYLNPSPRYVDQYLNEIGNPALRPQFTETFEANISVEDRPLFAIGRNNTRDIFTNVIYQNPDDRRLAYRTYDNLGSNRETYFRLLAGIPPIGRYFFVVGSQYNHNEYEGSYEGKPLSFSRGSWTFFTYHSLKIDSRSTFTLNGFIRTRGQLQFYELSNFGMLNVSLNRKFMKDKLLLTLTGNDIFFTNFYRFNIQQGTVTASGLRRNDTRRIGLTLRYNFGIRKREERVNMFNVDVP
ncbi:outer membrane beta-barrel protein [Tellurirhabdus rosea]|uniref:outer membrane beta-barrel protein n=1 Tax=Tellurirhabdus rosea TaxID=2674997 RepID=UPI00225A5806|nr:outer membrane beta-barrel protein [Tellurirhabdus rosea]